MMSEDLTGKLKQKAAEVGFTLSGVCAAVSPPGIERFEAWLAAGYAGQMHYLPDRLEAYQDPGRVLDGVKSILMLGMDYRTADPKPAGAGQGRVSRYAWGERDYHDLVRERLNRLVDWLIQEDPTAVARGVVDTAPLMEREFAQLAGLGWVGKNTLLLNRDRGSWFFLAALLTNLELVLDSPHATDHCGTCRACLDACPTDAFPQPYVLDASRCISYLTIELRSAIAPQLRAGVGDWLFGCDVCQDVCPWNKRAPTSEEAAFRPRADSNPMELVSLFSMTAADFRRRFRDTPFWRPRRRGLLRNAAIVLGNRPQRSAVPALVRGLQDEEPLVRGACAWALGRHSGAESRQALVERLRHETDVEVCQEIEAALQVAVDPVV